MNKGLFSIAGWLMLAPLAWAQDDEAPRIISNPAKPPAAAQPVSAPPAAAQELPAAIAESGACMNLFDVAGCGECGRGTFTAEYLLWWVRRGPLPVALVSAGTVDTGDPTTSSGPLTGPGTAILFGGQTLDFEAFSGGRWTWETWSSRNDNFGLQLGGFRLEQRSVGFSATSDANGNPIIARPVFDVINNEESALYVAYPDAFAGTVGVRADSNLWGIESNLMIRGRWDECRRTKWLVGYRHLDLEESIETSQFTTVLAGGGGSFNNVDLDPGDSVAIVDRFRGRNEFHGMLFGVQTEIERNGWTLGLSFKLSFGSNRQDVHAVGGSARFDSTGALTDTAYGGGLAVRTNSGTFRADDFVVIPEFGLKANYQVNDRLRAFLGYDFLYWNNVVRPGNQIDRNINVSHVPTSDLFNSGADPRRPVPQFRESDFWAQGLAFGIELRY